MAGITANDQNYLDVYDFGLQESLTVGLGTLIKNAENGANSPLANGKIFIGSAGGVAVAQTMSGDATIAASGALTIANLAVTDAKVAAAAAISLSKLAAMTSGYLLVGSVATVPTAVAMSGDATLAASGALTIANAAVTFAKLDPSVGQYTASIPLTQAQIQGLSVTPVQLIAAPAAGSLIMVDEVEVLHTYSTAVYANGGKLQIQYHSSTDIMDLAVGVVTGGASATYFARPSVYDVDNSTGSTPQALTSLTAKAVDLTNATAPFINGNAANVLKLRVKYRVVTLLT